MTDAELKTLVEKLIVTIHESHAETMARFDRIEARLDRVEADVAGLKAGMLKLEHKVDLLEVRLDEYNKLLAMTQHRLDDQARIIAALVPTRIAAIPGSAAVR